MELSKKILNLEELKKENFEGMETIKIKKEIIVTNKLFNEISDNFLKDNIFFEDKKYGIFKLTNEETKESFIFETQGYNYPRYTGLFLRGDE